MPPAQSGPNFNSFGGGAGAAGGIIGTNQLQAVVDKFAQAVAKLETTATRLSQISTGGGHGAAGIGGASQRGPGTSGFPGFPKMVNSFLSSPLTQGFGARPVNRWLQGGSVQGQGSYLQQFMYGMGSGGRQQQPAASNGFSTFAPMQNPFAAPAGGGGQPAPAQGQAAGGPQPINWFGGMQAPQGLPTVGPTSAWPQGSGQTGRAPNGGGAAFNGMVMGATIGMAANIGGSAVRAGTTGGGFGQGVLAGAGGIGASIANAAANASPNQLALNTLQQQSQLMGQSYKTTAQGAMGTAGNFTGQGQIKNQWSLNPQDAAQTYAIMQQATSVSNPGFGGAPGSNRFGAQNVVATMGGLSYANPSQTGTQNATAIQQLYSPQTSMAWMQMGMGGGPRAVGGQARPGAQIWATILGRLGGGKSISQQNLTAMLQPGQIGWILLQNAFPGATPTELQQYAQAIMQQNLLMNPKDTSGKSKNLGGMNQAQVNQVDTQLSGNPSQVKQGEQTLQKYGISVSDYQHIKSQAGTQAQNVSDTSGGYTKGLAQNTQALSKLNQTLGKLINTVGGGGPLGWLAGTGLIGMPGGSKVEGTSPRTNSSAAAGMASTLNPEAKKAVQVAESQLGVPYVYGQETPGKGFDCSGLPQWAYAQTGVKLPRTAAQQWQYLQKNAISPGKARQGDLVFTSGPGQAMHEAMLVNNGTQIIEAKGVGTKISLRHYSPAEWQHAARPWDSIKNSASRNQSAGATGANRVGGGAASGGQIASYAESFATGTNHPYAWGGDSPTSGWDCSGFAGYVYKHFGFSIPRTTTAIWADNTDLQRIKSPVPGALVLEDGSDPPQPGHMGIYVSAGKMAAAADVAEGTINEAPTGVWGYMIPKNGFKSGGAVTAAGGAAGAAAGGTAATAAATGGLGTPGPGMGDNLTGGSTNELAAFTGAVGGGAGAGGGGNFAANAAAALAAAGGGAGNAGGSLTGGAKGGSATAGTMSASAISAMWTKDGGPAGAAGNMARIAYAESGDRPGIIQQGQPAATTGWGLYQITPTSGIKQNGQFGNLLNADNNTKAAIALYKASGYAPWGSDPVGASLSGRAAGGSVGAGKTVLVGEKGPELATFAQGGTVYNAADSAKLMNNAMSNSHGYNYSALHSAYSGSGTAYGSRGGSGGVNVNFASGSIVINGGGGGGTSSLTNPGSPTAPQAGTTAAGMSTTGYTGEALAQSFAKQLQLTLSRMNVSQGIGTGVSS